MVFEKGSKLKVIREDAFGNCTKLEKIDLPGELKSIETAAFWGCCSLKKIKFPNGLEKIGRFCF